MDPRADINLRGHPQQPTASPATTRSHSQAADEDGSSTPVALSISPPPKRRRGAATIRDCCRTCRLRKVKCTGNPGQGACSNCERLDLECAFTEATNTPSSSDKVARSAPSHSHTEAGTLRKRAQRACSQCHSHKTKCSGDLPKCKRCEAGGLVCEYTPARRNFSNLPQQDSYPQGGAQVETAGLIASQKAPPMSSPISPNTVQTTNFLLLIDVSGLTAEQHLARKNLILRHYDAFLEHLYSGPVIGFLHPETTYQQIHDGLIHPARAAAICSAACFFVNPGEASRDFGSKCSDQVEFYLFRNIYKFTEEMLVLYSLNMVFNFLNGSFAKVWTLFGIATRLMFGLQANWENQSKGRSFVEQETLRRIAWQIWNMDRLLAGGYEEYVSCRKEIMKIRLPCNEQAFRDNKAVVVERLQDKPGKSKGAMGMNGWHLRLIDVRHRIQVMTRKLMPGSGANRAQLEPSRIMSDINGYQNELHRIHAALPPDLRLSDQSVSHYVNSPHRSGYVFLHTHLAVSHLDLYRFALPNMHEQTSSEVLRQLPQEFVAKCQKQTVGHALTMARFCTAIQDEIEKEPKSGELKLAGDVTIGHMATQCIRVLLIALQHTLYEDLDAHSTAPLWRLEPVNESYIRRLIDGLLRVTEPWCEVLPITKAAQLSNRNMLADFDKTRKFADQVGSVGFSGRKPISNGTSLPGPHYILENMPAGVAKDEERNKASSAALAARWFKGDSSATATSPNLPLLEEPSDLEFGPPGVPLFLAQARGAATVPPNGPETTLYATDTSWMAQTSKPPPWTMTDVTGMIDNHQMMPSDAVQMIPVDPNQHSASNSQAYAQAPHPQPNPMQFMPAQPQMYMPAYPHHYHIVQPDPNTYITPGPFG